MDVLNRGKPAVTVVTEQFVGLAKQVARGLKYPDLPLVVLPHPFEILSREEVRRLAEEKYQEIVAKIAEGPWV